MTEETKRVIDVVLAIVAMVGAALGFMKAVHEWQVSQQWKRAEHLDGLIARFESDPLLRLGCTLVDWTFRSVRHDGKSLKITNADVLLALRQHVEDGVGKFDGNQALVRDCLDAMLGFLSRVETALASGLIDDEPTRKHFAYWLRKLVTMDAHPVSSEDPNFDAIREALGGRTPAKMIAGYIAAYGDTESFHRLCERLSVPMANRAAES